MKSAIAYVVLTFMSVQPAEARCWTDMDVKACMDAGSLIRVERSLSLQTGYLVQAYLRSQEDFNLRSLDLNKDGQPEMKMHLVSPNTCTMSVAACVHVVQSTGPDREVLFAYAAHEFIVHNDETRNGWPIIETKTGGANRCTLVKRYAHDGQSYKTISDPVRNCT